MPPIAAAIGAIAGGVATAGGAVLAAGTSVLGGLAAAGTSTLGGLAAAGTSVLGGLAKAAPQAVAIGQAGQQIYGLFQDPDQPTLPQPTGQAATQYKSMPLNVLSTLPNYVRTQTQAQPQIITTPAPTPAPENKFIKYAPWIAAAIAGYFLFLR